MTTAPTHRIHPFEEVTGFDHSADVVICGFGGAGGSAALEARRAGAEIIILERAGDGGGATAMSSCEMYLGGSGGTALQQDCGFEDSTENMVAYLDAAFGAASDKERNRIYAKGAAEHFEWAKSLDVPYRAAFFPDRDVVPLSDESLLFTGSERAHPFTEIATPIPRGHVPSHEGDEGGQIFMNRLMATVREEGSEVICDARVVALIQDKNGRVRGVVARIDNQEQTIEARRGVILSTGGFIMNDEMTGKHLPQLRAMGRPYGNAWDMGDGIILGMAAGGHAIHMGEAFMALAFYPPAKLTHGIFVNGRGQRFVNEDAYLARLAHYGTQQDGEVYLFIQNEDFEPSLYFERLRIVATGETVAEVEAETELPKGALGQTVEYYNQHAERGEDPLFHKAANWVKPIINPPFALVSYCFDEIQAPIGDGPGPLMFTLGGLEASPAGEIVTPDGAVVPGLYGAGRAVSSFPRTGAGYNSGMSVGDATFFGRIAGQEAAKNQPA